MTQLLISFTVCIETTEAATNNTNRGSSGEVWSDLCPTLSSLLKAEPDKDWVSHLDQDVVHTVDMNIHHSAILHVL